MEILGESPYVLRLDLGAGIGGVAVAVTDILESPAATRHATEEIFRVLWSPPQQIYSIIVLYEEGPPEGEVVVDFQPGPVRFMMVRDFIERLRDEELGRVVADMLGTPPRQQPAHGRVQAIDVLRGMGTIDPAEELVPVVFEIPADLNVPLGGAVTYSYDLTGAIDVEHAQAVNVQPAAPDATPDVKQINAWITAEDDEGGPPDTPQGTLEVDHGYQLRIKVGDPEAEEPPDRPRDRHSAHGYSTGGPRYRVDS